eukprot:gene6904-14017_t
MRRGKKVSSKPTAVFDDDAEIDLLRTRVIDESPESGTQLSSKNVSFTSLPISNRTLQGLSDGKLTLATDIQIAAIPHALAGRDILGAAKTGSGKTLSFVIPVIERLYRERWGLEDGLGALIISPTRELALQIFDVIRLVGKKHNLSAGLITGGKKEFEEEQLKIVRMNILVATPGRLLQHFEQTVGFDAGSLQILVLDEADRLLDMGFAQQLDAVVSYLPNSRQTLLFSATQTKSVKDLARLSLRSAEYLSIYAEEDQPTPAKLQQHYLVCSLQQKLDVLFSFIKSHLGSKIIVFMSTCSQVRFVYECFCGMQPGIPLLALHGKVKQERRLDFPAVDWVVQLDAPEDASMYIHRVGRTARYKAIGRALLILMPCEEQSVLKELKEVDLHLGRLSVNPKMAMSVSQRAAALLAEQPECRNLAKKAFSGYLRSLTLLPSRKAINPTDLPLDEFSASYGLAFTPIPPSAVTDTSDGRNENREKKNVNRKLDKLKKQIKEAKLAKKALKIDAETQKSTPSTSNKNTDVNVEEEDFLIPKQTENNTHQQQEKDNGDDHEDDTDMKKLKKSKGSKGTLVTEPATVKGKKKPLRIRPDGTGKTAADRTKVLFDEEGHETEGMHLIHSTEVTTDNNNNTNDNTANEHRKEVRAREAEEHLRRVKARIDEGRFEDSLKDKERVRNRHRELRMRDKGEKNENNNSSNAMAVLSNPDEEEEGDYYSSGGEDSGNNNNEHDYDDNDSDDNEGSDENGDGNMDMTSAERQALRMLS